jgi:ATP synthase protein I
MKAEEAAEDRRRMSAESQRVIRSAGARILSVLIGYPLGGALIGWALDQWLRTLPWLTLGLMFLGFGLAFREVLRAAKKDPKSGRGVE